MMVKPFLQSPVSTIRTWAAPLAALLVLCVVSPCAVVSAQVPAPAVTETSVVEVVPTMMVPPLVEPLTTEQIDIFLDSIRAGSEYILPPIRTNQKVDQMVAGVWAGSEFSPQSDFGEFILRFRPTTEARLARADKGQKGILADFVDVVVKRTVEGIVIQHPLAVDAGERAGLLAKLSSQKLFPTRTAFVKAARDSGMYFSLPSMLSDHAANGWGLLICPRMIDSGMTSRGRVSSMSLAQSPYELAEVKLSVTGRVSASISTGAAKERLALSIMPTENVPSVARSSSDEIVALSPNLSLFYSPAVPFDFFRFAPKASVQEGLQFSAEMQNKAGYVKRTYFTNIVYIQKLERSSRISPPAVVNGLEVMADTGTCYTVLTQKTQWSEYDRRRAGF